MADFATALLIDPAAAEAAKGRYRSDVLGEVTLRREDDRLVFDIGTMAGEVRVDPQRPDRWIIWEGPLFTMPQAFDPEARTLTFGEGAAQYVFEAVQ